MIGLSDDAAAILGRSFVLHTRVESWLGEDVLSDDVPVAAGTLDVDRTLRVPERVTLTVPRLDRDVLWDPQGDDTHPLACWGQRLKVSLGVEVGGGAVEWLTRGWFLVNSTGADGDVVTVEAVGLLQLIDEARFTSPFQPSGTFESTLRALVEPALTVDVDAALTDRAVPSGMAWDEDRIGGLFEVLDAWPAEAVVSPDGYLSVVPAVESTTPVLALTDGADGTVVQWAGETTRAGAASLVVARGQAADGTQVQGAAYEAVEPSAYGGPFNPLPVPFFYFSPLLTTNAQCRSAAQTVLARRRRAGGRRLTAQCVPHPGLEAGDLVTVTSATLDGAPCLVESLSLPLVADGGAMTLGLREVRS